MGGRAVIGKISSSCGYGARVEGGFQLDRFLGPNRQAGIELMECRRPKDQQGGIFGL